jgi:hypothetical protein
MRDVAFLVKLPERDWPGISIYTGLQSRRPSSEVKNLQKRMMLNY